MNAEFKFNGKTYIHQLDENPTDKQINLILRKIKQHFYDRSGMWYKEDKYTKRFDI